MSAEFPDSTPEVEALREVYHDSLPTRDHAQISAAFDDWYRARVRALTAEIHRLRDLT